MKKLIYLLFLFLPLFSYSGDTLNRTIEPIPDQRVVNDSLKNTVVIHAKYLFGQKAIMLQCYGAVYNISDKDTYILTARHCVEDTFVDVWTSNQYTRDKETISFNNGDRESADIVQLKGTTDLAVLLVKNYKNPTYFRSFPSTKGEYLFSFDSFSSFSYTVNTAFLVGQQGDEEYYMFNGGEKAETHIFLTPHPGMSGGPVIDFNGFLVGIFNATELDEETFEAKENGGLFVPLFPYIYNN